jgi:hypothetical protein
MTIDTVELLDQLGAAVRRDAARGRRRRRLTAAAVMASIVAVAGVAVAGTYDDWWTNNAPAVQPGQLGEVAKENRSVGIELDLAKKATVARTDDATLDAVATNGGKGYCMSLFVGTKHMGSSCTTVADSEYRTRADDGHWVGYGRILDSGAAALDLSSVGLPGHVRLERGGFFLFDLPRAQWHALDGRSGDVAILGADGKTIRTACVYVGVAPPSPYAGAGGLGDKPGACAQLAPIIPDPELDRAKKLVSTTLAHDHPPTFSAGETISVWRAPNRGGGVCWYVGPQPSQEFGGSCARDEQRVVDGQLPLSASNGIVSGFAPAGTGIVRVTIDGAQAALANGAFVGEAGDGRVTIVGYDATGAEVARTKLPG